MEVASIIAGLALAHALALLANRIAGRLVRSGEMLDGFPRWRWVLSAFTQAVIMPALVLLAWHNSSVSLGLGQWLAASARDLPGFERWYVYALFASNSRDMFPMPAEANFLLKVHHWIVVSACVLALFAPQGFGLFVGGTFLLELGSMTFNLRCLYPQSMAINVAYQICMPVSNVAAVAGGVAMLGMTGIPVWMKALYFVVDVGVCIGRQRHAFKDAGLFGGRSHGRSSDEASASQAAPAGAGRAAEAPLLTGCHRLGCGPPPRRGRRCGRWVGGLQLLSVVHGLRQGTQSLRRTSPLPRPGLQGAERLAVRFAQPAIPHSKARMACKQGRLR
mmetsp:Transcript_79511/g.170399  ORF Transcript_79511/g.170399 Transcript_79511/m.170399 type:complete len:333 (-) Transcript_79511:69-1067(-)